MTTTKSKHTYMFENKIYLSKDGKSNTYVGSLAGRFSCANKSPLVIPIKKYTTNFNVVRVDGENVTHISVILLEESLPHHAKYQSPNEVLIIND